MKIFSTTLAIVFCCLLSACQMSEAAQSASEGPVPRHTKPAHNPQYAAYQAQIETALRGLSVRDDFTLVDDPGALMQYHARHITGRESRYGGMLSFYGNQIDVSQCSADLGRTNSKASSKISGQNLPSIVNRCHNMLAQLFRMDPVQNVGQYRAIVDYWLANDILINANAIQSRMGAEATDYAYALSSNVAKVMAHMAVYHRLYGYSDSEMQQVVSMFEEFAATYDYSRPFRLKGDYFAKVCNLSRPVVPEGTNDHCGSFNTRMAVGATLFGLEFGSQLIFDKGIQHTEIMLATFDKNKMYTSQIWRHDGLSYADQIGPAIDQLDYALDKAFGIDFADMQNIHGVTPGEVYQHLWTVANDPTLLLPYMNAKRRLDPHYYSNVADYDGANMFTVIRRMESGELPRDYNWQAFNERRYILTVPGLAKEFQPDLWRKWRPRIEIGDYDFGQRITGFSVLILRQATQRW